MENNGWLSKHCSMSRGIRQGFPISAKIYLFVAELLVLKIQNNPNIEGISVKSNEIKNIQHADDLTVDVKDENSLLNTVNAIHEIC